eukprot:GHVU01094889.1.p2 GENE.GHVU01094889.1~~GHVU01094889.1.p2  ORF type:complete len:132 (+),score=4.26 GHVU01094889.1:608-1003(+)
MTIAVDKGGSAGTGSGSPCSLGRSYCLEEWSQKWTQFGMCILAPPQPRGACGEVSAASSSAVAAVHGSLTRRNGKHDSSTEEAANAAPAGRGSGLVSVIICRGSRTRVPSGDPGQPLSKKGTSAIEIFCFS